MSAYYASPGSPSFGLTLNADDSLTVVSGGYAAGTTVNAFGEIIVQQGGVASNTTVNSVGELYTYGGSTVGGTTLNSGGFAYILGSANVTQINSGAYVVFDGTGSATTVENGGYAIFAAGSVDDGTTAVNGGAVLHEVVSAGQSFTGDTVNGNFFGNNNVYQTVYGMAISTLVTSQGVQNVSSGGQANDTTLVSGGAQTVYASGTALGTVISSGGNLYVRAGGVTGNDEVSSGGDLTLSGGLAYNITVQSGGEQNVYGGTASTTTLSSGAQQEVESGGAAYGTVIQAGALDDISSGGISYNDQLQGKSFEFVEVGGAVSGATIGNGGFLLVANAGGIGNFHGTFGTETVSGVFSAGTQTTDIIVGSNDVKTVSSGGTENVYYNGTLASKIVQSGNEQYTTNYNNSGFVTSQQNIPYSAAGSAASIDVQNGGTIFLAGGTLTGTSQVGAGATIEVGGVFTISVASGTDTFTVSGITLNAAGDGLAIANGAVEIINAGNSVISETLALGGTQQVLSGATASGTIISNGGTQSVSAGAHVISTMIKSGGQQNIDSGATISATQILGGGSQTVSSGASAVATTVSSGGTLNIYGSATSTTILHGGSETIFSGLDTAAAVSGVQIISGGTAASSTVASGGSLNIYTGSAVDAQILLSATETIFGGTDTAATVDGQQIISGGAATGGTIDKGGSLYVHEGTASDESILSGATETVFSGQDTDAMIGGQQIISGGAATGGTVLSGGSLTLFAGSATGTQINLSATETVFSGQDASAIVDGKLIVSGGTALTDKILSGGLVQVFSGGDAIETQVNSSGTLAIYASGHADGAQILSKGVLQVFSGGLASGSLISAGGTEQFMSGAKTNGGKVFSGGTIDVSGGAVASATVLSGGAEYIAAGGVAAGAVLYGGTMVGSVTGSTPRVISGGALVVVSGGGSALNLQVNDGNVIVSSGGFSISGNLAGDETVYSGGTDSGLASANYGSLVVSGGTVVSGNLGIGYMYVYGGTASAITDSGGHIFMLGGILQSATLAAGQVLSIQNSASASATAITASGGQINLSAGSLQGATITGSASLFVSGGTAGGITVNGASAGIAVLNGGVISGTILSNAGVQIISAGGTEQDTTIATGGVEVIYDGGIAGGNVIAGGTLGIVNLENAGSSPLLFSGAGGDLRLADNVTTATVISGFAAGDSIDLFDVAYSAANSVSSFGDIVTVTSGGSQTQLDLQGTSGAQFALTTLTVSGITYTRLIETATSMTSGGTDTFRQNVAATTGPLSGDYLWSNPLNWSSGAVPANGGSVVESASGADDIASLSLANLSLNSGADLAVTSGALSIAALAVSGATLIAEGVMDHATGPIAITAGSITGSGGVFGADGATSIFTDESATGPGATYEAANGGRLILSAAPNAASVLEFGGQQGTIAFGTLAPGAITAALENLRPGDVIELPGTASGAASFSGHSLTISTTGTDGGTYIFSDVTYATSVTGYIATTDASTGLEAITLTGGNVAGIDAAGGQTTIIGAGTIATNPTLSGGTLELQSGAIVSGAISFTGTGSTLLIEPDSNGGTVIPANTIIGFTAGDTIKLPGIPFAGTGGTYGTAGEDTYTVATAGTLTIDAAGTFYKLAIASATVGEQNFILNGDLGITEATCFAAGTKIATPKGEVAVETLSIGDEVQTLHAGPRKIKWIGTRSYDGRLIAGKHLILPIRISAGALDDAVPLHDLFVSPGHGILVNGVLVPAWRLINGVSVTQAARVTQITYYHIELETHEILLAENCPAESFCDASLRGQFQNAATYFEIYQDAAPASLGRPQLESGFALQAIQRQIGARAGITATTQPIGRLRGFIDQTGPLTITGWAQDEAAPEEPVCLDIYQDGRGIGRVLANQYRADLREAGLGSGCHAFEFGLTEPPAETLEVRRSDDGAALAPTDIAAVRAATIKNCRKRA